MLRLSIPFRPASELCCALCTGCAHAPAAATCCGFLIVPVCVLHKHRWHASARQQEQVNLL
jgi:hypothetical protein